MGVAVRLLVVLAKGAIRSGAQLPRYIGGVQLLQPASSVGVPVISSHLELGPTHSGETGRMPLVTGRSAPANISSPHGHGGGSGGGDAGGGGPGSGNAWGAIDLRHSGYLERS